MVYEPVVLLAAQYCVVPLLLNGIIVDPGAGVVGTVRKAAEPARNELGAVVSEHAARKERPANDASVVTVRGLKRLRMESPRG